MKKQTNNEICQEERRKNTRAEVNWEIHVDLSGSASLRNSINVSKGGMLIQSPIEMTTGSFIDLSVELQMDCVRKVCQATCEVIESRPNDKAYDVAVKFTRLDDVLKSYIAALI